MTAQPVGVGSAISRIEALLVGRERVFVAIDGPCASGKTTLARALNERFGGDVLHMDDFVPNSARRNVWSSPAATWTVSGSSWRSSLR